MGLVQEFKTFAIQGNMIDMAVGLIIGAEFGKIVNSLVADIIMPPLGYLIGNVDYRNLFFLLKEGSVPAPYPTLADAQKAGAVTMNYGLFLSTTISFFMIAFAIFLLVKVVNQLRSTTAGAKA